MPTEQSVQLSPSTSSTPAGVLPQASHIKCSQCGAASASGPQGWVLLVEPMERICGNCLGARITSPTPEMVDAARDYQDPSDTPALELELEGRTRGRSIQSRAIAIDIPPPSSGTTIPGPGLGLDHEPTPILSLPVPQSSSLPTQSPRPWSTTTSTSASAVNVNVNVNSTHSHADTSTILVSRNEAEKEKEIRATSPPEREASPVLDQGQENEDKLPNRLLDVCQSRMSSRGRGALYPGASFKGTQTSGRSAYEVEVKIVDVNFPESSVSGHLSISHLTDAHPHLTTFFTGEIIGPQYGFITGARYGATEHDDMRHWGRFEQFRRPTTRADMLRPELFFRDPLPDASRGETQGKERDFVFLRIKERFLVPDHKVKDISGASFAGFYYAMIDFSPSLHHPVEAPPLSPSSPKIPLSPPPMGARRPSESMHRRASMSEYRVAQAKLARAQAAKEAPQTEATIRGYYFHSLNQEPFQELFLVHSPTKSTGAFELR